MSRSKRIRTGITILTGLGVAGALIGLIVLAVALHT